MYDWLYHISDNLQTEDLDACLAILRTSLHELRDHIPLVNAVHLSQQLPLMVRGIFFEAWDPEYTPIKPKELDDILAQIRHGLRAYPSIDAKQALLAAYRTLWKMVPNGTWKNVVIVAPKGFKEIFHEVKQE
jgi:uncharacterized protein (DUF2267 family)